MTRADERRFNALEIDDYQSQVGETLRVATDEAADLQTLREIFAEVASKAGIAYDLRSVPGTHSETVRSVTLVNASGATRIQATPSGDGTRSIVWLQDHDGWMESAELVDALIEGPGNRHQYLTGEDDDVFVEVSYKE